MPSLALILSIPRIVSIEFRLLRLRLAGVSWLCGWDVWERGELTVVVFLLGLASISLVGCRLLLLFFGGLRSGRLGRWEELSASHVRMSSSFLAAD
jgi:hypothetical protein